MAKKPPQGMPRIAPNLFYDDPAAALDWLAKNFGFTQRSVIPGPDGKVMHAEMDVVDSVIMMSPTSGEDAWTSPATNAGAVTQSLYVYVDDVDTHYRQARENGATILAELEDMFWGDRTYVAEDIEGHRWTFATQVREIAPEDMQIPGA